ncbi:MAG: YceD family protein [Verrucomicrobiia bacterium]
MPIKININDLEKKEILFKGALPVKELEIDGLDRVIHANHDLNYDFTVQKIEKKILLSGSLSIDLDCECVRCLKEFVYSIVLDNWALMLELEGEERVQVVNDIVDLTPYIREDILLNFPLHPVCEPGCAGMPELLASDKGNAQSGKLEPFNPVWAELDKLKLK